MDIEGVTEPTQATKRRRLVLFGLLICALVAAVAIPVALTRNNDSSSNGEIQSVLDGEDSQEPSDKTSEAQLSEKLLSDVFSSSSPPTSTPFGEILVEDSLISSNQTSNETNTTEWYNITTTNQTNATLGNEIITGETLPPLTAVPLPAPTMAPTPQITTVVRTFEVLRTIPHDTSAFTQGLTFDPTDNTILYESTGLYGQSDVRKVVVDTGEVLTIRDSPSSVFGEGLAYYTIITPDSQLEGRLIHITWTSQRGFIFEPETLELLEEFTFSTQKNEGWGITYWPSTNTFIVTDGSEYIHFWTIDREEIKRIPVTMQMSESSSPQPVFNLNEIEWDDETNTILANIWQQDTIVRIDPNTGAVITFYDMTDLFPRSTRPNSADVLNGIAINGDGDLFVTGKLWPAMYEIRFIE